MKSCPRPTNGPMLTGWALFIAVIILIDFNNPNELFYLV